jgi:hypothetical protein
MGTDALDTDVVLKNILFVMVYARKYLMTAGKVENLLVLVDLDLMGISELPVGLLKPFKAVLDTLFRCTACRIVMVGASSMFCYAWSGIKLLLAEAQKRKVVILNGFTCPELTDNVDPDQLIEKYGGTCKAPEKWWPPTMPDTQKVREVR